ncbi:MAG: dockerin type I repeat-containing protein, partial [Clostridia bacterium]|nr:dockerin type I repeat-containing protein [Clostridia bacterium]
MKRIIAMALSVIMLVTSTLFVVEAASVVNPCIRVEDTTGMDGYSAAMDDINAMVQSKGGVTVVMDVLVEETTTPAENMFSQLVAFTGGGDTAKYNLLSYDFGAEMFKAGQSMEWVSNEQADYSAIATNSFKWELGRWYELAFRFNGTKAAIYLNGICVISTEFDATQTDYLIVYPQFCTARFDNVRICAKDYNVAEGTGTVWAAEDFDDLSSPDESAVWYAATYEMSELGCNGIITSSTDTCISLNDTDGTSGYMAALDEYNAMVDANDGATIVADILVESYTEAPAGSFSQIVAFTGAYDANARYNYTGYDFGKGAFTAKEGGAWISGDHTDMYTEKASSSYALEMGVWYEFAWQFTGNKVNMYLNGEKVLSAEFGVINNSYFIMFPQYCDIRIDNLRICDKNYSVADGVGTVWAAEDFEGLASAQESAVLYCDSSYTLSNLGPDASNAGDANGDGKVNTSDIVVLRRKISGANIAIASGADVNVDGIVNTADITLLSRIISGYSYKIDYSVNVTPVTPDNSAVVEDDEGGNTPGGETPAETSTSVTQTEPPATSTSTAPAEPESNETFIDGLDGSTLKFNGMSAASYTFLHREGGVSYDGMGLSFDVLVSEIDETQEFAGLGVWNGNKFVGYDFKDQVFVYDTISYSYAPATNNGTKLALKVGEWNHFNFRRIDNNTFHLYVNGVKKVELTGQSYTNTFFLFGFKGCTGYVDNYQYYDAGTGCGLIDDFSTFKTDGSMLKSSDGGYWLIGAQGFGSVCTDVVAGAKTASGIAGTAAAAGDVIKPEAPTTTEAPVTTATPYDPAAPVPSGSGNTAGLDESALKFDTLVNASYTLLFSDQPQSWADMALTFDVYIESVDAAADFAGLGVWSGNGDTGVHQFTGFDFNSKQFASGELWYPTVPADNNGPKLNLAVGEWNHFCFRRLNNNTFEIYVNGTLRYTVTNQKYENTYFLFGFKGVVAYVDNYQYYHSGIACGLVDDFITGSGTKDGMTIFSDGGYWLVGSQSFAGVVPVIDNTAIDNTISLISAIGTVTYKSLSAITAAESAYAALS